MKKSVALKVSKITGLWDQDIPAMKWAPVAQMRRIVDKGGVPAATMSGGFNYSVHLWRFNKHGRVLEVHHSMSCTHQTDEEPRRIDGAAVWERARKGDIIVAKTGIISRSWSGDSDQFRISVR